MRQKADTVTAVPALLAEYVAMLEQELHVISAGCAVGTLKGQILVPDADLNTGIEVLILIALSLPAVITTIIWEKKYKALLAAETGAETNSTK